MDIEYLSESDSDNEYVKPVVVSVSIKKPPEISNMHQIINYPELERHSTKSIVAICTAIDSIDQKLQFY